MMFNWKRKGQIWAPSLKNTWMQEYGQNANALILKDKIRIYFSSRKKSADVGGYISYIFFVDVARDDPTKVIYIHETPLLNVNGRGSPGAFDEFGAMPGSVLWREDLQEVWLYYVGWSRSGDKPYRWANGLAISKDGGTTFEKVDQQPIISSQYHAPYLQACPRVFRFDGGQWFMWYASGVEWFESDGRQNPIYVLMSATSTNGIDWELSHKPTLPAVLNKECQSSASVIFKEGQYHMFFSYRDVLPDSLEQKQYRVGYACSDNLVDWQRDDAMAGIKPLDSGWDSVAICYPHVVMDQDKTYLFYSGNEYGCAGFGCAELIE